MSSKQIITLVVVAIAGLVVGYFIGGSMQGIKPESKVSLNNDSDSLNYFLGLNLGYDLSTAPFDADADLIASGINQVLNDSSVFDQTTAQMVFRQLQIGLADKQSIQQNADAAENLEKGAVFLEENAKREGVITTESGLQYEILTQGDGERPTDTSTVTVNYEGSLIDGTVFESSFDRDEPVTFPLNGVIPGWTEGVQLMPVGSTYKFYIPSDLAYGERGQGPIPGNSVLIFKIELLGIE